MRVKRSLVTKQELLTRQLNQLAMMIMRNNQWQRGKKGMLAGAGWGKRLSEKNNLMRPFRMGKREIWEKNLW